MAGMGTPTLRPGWVKVGLIVLTGVAFGSSVVVNRLGIREIPPLPFVGLRLLVAALAFVLILAILRRSVPRNGRTWADLAFVGLTNAAFPVMAFTLALQFISSAVLTVFITLAPLFTAALAHWLLPGERLTPNKLAGLFLAFGGVLLLLGTSTNGLADRSGFDLRGQLLGLAGALSVAVSVVYTRLRLRGTDPMTVSALQTVIGLLLVAPLSLGGGLEPGGVSGWGWFAVVYTGLVGSSLAILLVFYMVRRYGATVSSLPTYVMPAAAALLGTVVLGEVLTLPLAGGAGLVLLGVYLAGR